MSSVHALREQAAMVALLRTRPNGAAWPEITADILERGSAAEVWAYHRSADLFGATVEDEALKSARVDVQDWTADGTRMLTILDAEYPERLRAIHQAPPVLFARGEIRPHDRAVSIVGSRAASPRGIELAERIASAIVELGLTVASGLAVGIDATAHRAALDAGGRTVAFVGTGIRRHYPSANEQLQDTIAARGLLLSQFWPDAPPRKYTFLMRNAVMSGYGLATIVVEASETSGSRAQARMAVEHGRPVILTDIVVHANKWAQRLLDQPGVRVATSLSEIVNIVSELAHSQPSAEVRKALELMTA
jgi:DNA processing protein